MTDQTWTCGGCGHEVPLENEEVHALHCVRHVSRPRDGLSTIQPRTGSSGARSSRGSDNTSSNQTRSGTEASAAPHGVTEDVPSRGWACSMCTFENTPDRMRCEMCGTRNPGHERPPDEVYRDMLIGGGGGGAAGFRQDPFFGDDPEWAAVAAAMTEACRTPDRRRAGDSSVPSTGADVNSRPTLGDAATGSAIGALGAGMLSALYPNNSRDRLLSSMMQGALIGGVAGASFGPELRQNGRPARQVIVGVGNEDQARNGVRRRVVYRIPVGPGSEAGMAPTRVDPDVMSLEEQIRRMGLFDPSGQDLFARAVFGGGGGLGTGETRPAAATSLSSLPEEALTRSALDLLPADGRQCCICLEDFALEEKVTRLPCLHMYHSVCIKGWLRTSGVCPTCKHRVD